MADFNALYAVVDKSKKRQKSFIPFPEDGTAESPTLPFTMWLGEM